MPPLTELLVWNDLTPRSGAMNMAVDQLLLEGVHDTPVLRFYSWESPAVSFGYFDSLATARSIFTTPNLDFTRRWTGGGIVDHRIDLTYTLAIPRSHPWPTLRGAESYRVIHEAVADALNQTGSACELTPVTTGDGSATCFTNPVAYDIITPSGDKLAGAGQKRTRHGLLHQGSVINVDDREKWQESFIHYLTKSTTELSPGLDFFTQAKDLANSRYASQKWLEKRA